LEALTSVLPPHGASGPIWSRYRPRERYVAYIANLPFTSYQGKLSVGKKPMGVTECGNRWRETKRERSSFTTSLRLNALT